MFDGLINNLFVGAYSLAGSLISGIMSPWVNMIMNVVPDAESRYLDVLAFITQAGTFVTTIYRWFLFTRPMFQVLFLYFFVKYSIFLIAGAMKLILRFKKYIFV